MLLYVLKGAAQGTTILSCIAQLKRSYRRDLVLLSRHSIEISLQDS